MIYMYYVILTMHYMNTVHLLRFYGCKNDNFARIKYLENCLITHEEVRQNMGLVMRKPVFGDSNCTATEDG